jgi:hypothetical protein
MLGWSGGRAYNDVDELETHDKLDGSGEHHQPLQG